MPWSPQPQIMARTKASHIRLPAEPAEHRVVAGTLTNRRRMGQEARRLERTFGPQRFNHLRRPATPPPEWHIDGEGTPPPVRYGRPRRAKRAPAPAPAPVPLGDSGHLVLPDDCVWPPPDSFREKSQTGGRPRPRADKFVAKSIVRNNGGALRHVEPELKGDRDVVLAAVRNSGRALEHASPSLRNDAAVVKVAVTQDATALAFASHKLRCDPDVFETAMASQGSRYGWGDSPKRSPTKSSSMEFPAPLSPKAKDLVPSPQAKEPGVARQGSVVLEGSG